MAQVIDALLITFGIDTREFDKARQKIDDGTKNLRETSKKNADYMESQGKRAAGFFSSIKNEMLALAGVSLTFGGTLGFVKGMTGDLQALANQSQVLGLSAKQLDGWARAAEAAGSSAEKITGTLGDLNTKLMLFRQGKADPALMGALQMLSQDTGAVFNPLQSDAQGILKQALQAAKKDKNPERARVALRQMGLDDATINSALNGQLLPNVERFTTGSGINDANLKAAKEFNEQWTVLAQNFDALKNKLFNGLIPVIQQVNTSLTDLSQNRGPISDFFGELSKDIKGITGIDLGKWSLKQELDSLMESFKELSNMFTHLGNALNALNNGEFSKAADEFKKAWYGTENGKENGKDYLPGVTKSAEQNSLIIGGKTIAGWMTEAYEKIAGKKAPEERKHDQDEKSYWDTTKEYLGKISDYFVAEAGAAERSPSIEGYQPNVPLNATAARLGPKGKALLNAMSGEFGMLEGKYGLPAGLLRGVAATESGGDPYAVSKAGAKGLFQFMPGTAKDMGLNGSDVYDPKKSAEAAAKYLHYLIMATGDTQSALQAYNWGLGNLQKKGMQNAPKETQEYYAKVVANMRAGAGMAADSVAPYRAPSQGGQSFHIQQMQVVTPASSVGRLSQDMSRSAQNRATLIGYDSGQSGG
ncbi:lytic transglycosylase domain-containing protein [Klebsiella quasipneumoniae]|uniref:lytic transglycosylase domain-containing protein n=1 Tax=Klebsiella quasipneumoniae TaxID=1463165 RepID=UPI00272F64C9|nr:lytic transglycosylase domain-containing protein [Klebsiella quasipneumoniae]MDP1297865.1 lytic transglycosylase domain-containing protein [Klebsiella quasipneumoniae]